MLDIDIDGAEAHVLLTALAMYRGELARARDRGAEATEVAVLLDTIAERVQRKIDVALYGEDEPAEPDWDMPESADPVTQAKACRLMSWQSHSRWSSASAALGEYPSDMGYHDWQSAVTA